MYWKGHILKRVAGPVFIFILAASPCTWAADLTLVDAAKSRHMDAVRSLLDQQPGMDVTQEEGDTPLHWAVYWDELDMAKLLIGAGADTDAKNDQGVSPLILACRNGNDPMVEVLLNSGADPNQAAFPNQVTPLMMCARTGRVDAIKYLIEKGADPNLKETRRGQTALMWAVAQGHAPTAEVLIQLGADVHARASSGFTPLIFAARMNELATAEVLLAAGADVNAKAPLNTEAGSSDQTTSDAAMTPLLMASASGHEEIALYLLKNGADPNAWDGGAAPLHYALMEGISYFQFRDSMDELVRELLAHGADPNMRFEKTIVKTRGYDTINMPGPGGTPLLIAAATPDPQLMRLLLAHGADPHMKTYDNVTALMAVAGVIREQAYTDTQIENGLKASKILIDLGVDLNATSDIGRTALHGATQVLANPLIQYLAEQGADVDARDIYQQTPLSAAMGVRLPWVQFNPLGEEGFVRQSTVDLLLSLGATPLDTPGYFKPVEGAEEYRYVPR